MLKALAVALTLLAVPALAHATPADEKAMQAIVRDYQAWYETQDPIGAGINGDKAALSKLPDITPTSDAARKVALLAFDKRVRAVPTAGLSEDSKLNQGFLERILNDQLQDIRFDTGRMPFNSDSGFHQTMAYLASSTPIDSEADALAWIARLEAMPKYYADNLANIRRGIRDGFTQPKLIAVIVAGQARRAADAPLETDPLLAPFVKLPASISPARQAELRARALAVLKDKVRPAQRDFAELMEKEYLPAARPGLGASTLPDGKAYYQWRVSYFTTTAMTPDEIHALGVSEVARIRAEMLTVMAQTGFKGSLQEFIAYLRTDPRFYAKTPEELLSYASTIAKRIDDQLPRWFGTLPRLTYGVRPVPAEIAEGYTSARYFTGSPRQGVAGGFMVNTSHLDQRPLYEMTALALHESVPGHHLQIALGQELDDVPAFRRDADMTAFTEGWGLYAEQLGDEMGIYLTPYDEFGRLSMEMWRACRLVADTGIHWLGWTKEEARTCFTDNTALAPLNIENELNRYIAWPGQALGYKIGELKIMSLRAKAKAELGGKFDIRRFHDAVLLAGPLPMDLLEGRIDRWIAAEKARK
ncbi:uncharacterized protein (DUF885 family) [Caulobacter ginsengisoli]|uniref:Uncharacterized protein (DUF885 family) n=1 Tax=Caulobacter ginsengisoli TaxID=400775 RepID=A0ABU0IRI6_9CAUL|nr:DUF885 family protein [Caulobacter ginsengisoli]MDQ0464631.1 uncharacterized protein (DUF885 family) [Caulobacter ginsengisoli]